MVDIDKIEQALKEIEAEIDRLARQFRSAYEAYLTDLGRSLHQQFVLAAFQLCTQRYPEGFLQLAAGDRHKLHDALRQSSVETRQKLLEPLQAELWQAEVISLQILEDWLEATERAIGLLLQELSRHTNQLLSEISIFPTALPNALLEAALQSEATGEGSAGPPNLLHIAVGKPPAEKGEASGDRVVPMQATLLVLRLSEIEFTDAIVTAKRNQIRQLYSHFLTIRKNYQRKQRERLVAEAEAGWRAIWHDD